LEIVTEVTLTSACHLSCAEISNPVKMQIAKRVTCFIGWKFYFELNEFIRPVSNNQ
jgi:hypothetical protein